MKTIVVEGASTAYGAVSGEYGGWAAQLHRDSLVHNSKNPFDNLTVTNLAVPALVLPAINRASGGMKERFRSLPSHSLVRILSVGQLESTIPPGGTRPLIDLDRFAIELEKYNKDSRDVGAQTLYVGPQLANEDMPRPAGWIIENDLIEEYASVMEWSASENGSPYVDVAQLFADNAPEGELLADGRHPNARGHQLIHAAVALELKALGIIEPNG